MRERRRVYTGYGHYVQLGELGNRVVVEAVVWLYGQELEANVLVALNAVYENVERVGNVVREVARGDVRLFENVEVRPFVSVIACRYAQLRRRAVPCCVVALLVVKNHRVGQAFGVYCLQAQVVRLAGICFGVPRGVPVCRVCPVDEYAKVFSFGNRTVVAVDLRSVDYLFVAVSVGCVLVV